VRVLALISCRGLIKKRTNEESEEMKYYESTCNNGR